MALITSSMRPVPRWVRTPLLCCLLGCGGAYADVVNFQYRVVNSFPHSIDVFTQGLVYENGILYESAGIYGESRLLTRPLNKDTPIKQVRLANTYFAEGITIIGEQIFQLTWKSRRGFIYNKSDLAVTGEFHIPGEGWGITTNGSQLIISDGSSRLEFFDPSNFKRIKSLIVRFDGKPVERLNELEWIEGKIFANVWGSNWIVIIDPDTGDITGKVRLESLLADDLRNAHTDVLNGIAYDQTQQRLLVTGKYWPRLYQIELIDPDKQHPIH